MSIQNYNIYSRLGLIGVAAIVFLLVVPFPILATHRFLVFSFGALLFIFYHAKRGIVLLGRDAQKNFYWMFFLGFALVSGLWASNFSLIWFPLAIFGGMFLWMISAEYFYSLINTCKLGRFFLFTFIFVYTYIFINYILEIFFVKIPIFALGYNAHYHTSLLVTLYPFVHFRIKGGIMNCVKMGLIASIFFLMIKTNSSGSILAFACVLLLIVWMESGINQLSFFTSGVFRWFLLLLTFIGVVAFSTGYQHLSGYLDDNDLGRIYQYRESFNLFINSNFLGIGMGNWLIETHNHDIYPHLGLLSSRSFERINNHSLYALLLAEVGIIGFSLYFLLIFTVWRKSIRHYHGLSQFEKACLYGVLLYCVVTSFYLCSFSYEGYFSGIQLLAFIFLGVLYGRDGDKINLTDEF